MKTHDNVQPTLWILRIQSAEDKATALSECCSALESYPKSADLWNVYGEILDHHAMQEKSLAAFRQAVSLAPENARFWNNLGVSLRKSGHVDEAEGAFMEAISLDSTFPNPQYNLRDVQLTRQRISHPAQIADRGSTAPCYREFESQMDQSADPQVWLSVADEFLEESQLEKATMVLKKAVRVCPESSSLWLKYVQCLERAGRSKQVDETLEKLVRLHPDNVEAWNWIAIRLLSQNDTENAIYALRKSVALQPANQHCRLLALLLDARGATEEAAAVLCNAVLDSDAPACRWNLLGVLLHKLSRYDKALLAFRQGINMDSNSSSLYNNLGRLLEDMKDNSGAARAFKKAIDLDKSNAIAWNNLGVLLRTMGLNSKAEMALRISISIAPHFTNPWHNLRDLCLSQGVTHEFRCSDNQLQMPLASKWAKAGWSVYDEDHISQQLVNLTREVDLAPDDHVKLHALALSLFDARRFGDSHERLLRAVALEQESAVLWNFLGMVSEKLGNIEDAVYHYRRALQADETYLCAKFNLTNALRTNQNSQLLPART